MVVPERVCLCSSRHSLLEALEGRQLCRTLGGQTVSEEHISHVSHVSLATGGEHTGYLDETLAQNRGAFAFAWAIRGQFTQGRYNRCIEDDMHSF